MRELDSILFSPKKYEERFFWTFRELLDPTKEAYQLSNSEILSIANSMTGYTTPLISSGAWTNNNYAKVLDLVIKRFSEKYTFFTLSEEMDSKKKNNYIAKLLYILEMTSPRYLKLLEVYESQKDKLLDPVKITSGGITRFNDTPQDEGDFANDEHTTNLTEDTRETSNELDTKMARIKEIESNYNNVLLNWSNEFESIFIEEGNI